MSELQQQRVVKSLQQEGLHRSACAACVQLSRALRGQPAHMLSALVDHAWGAIDWALDLAMLWGGRRRVHVSVCVGVLAVCIHPQLGFMCGNCVLLIFVCNAAAARSCPGTVFCSRNSWPIEGSLNVQEPLAAVKPASEHRSLAVVRSD